MENFQCARGRGCLPRDGERLPSIPHFGDMIETTILTVFYSPNTVPWAYVIWVFSGPIGQRYSWSDLMAFLKDKKPPLPYVYHRPQRPSIMWFGQLPLRAFVQSKFKIKRTPVNPGFMYIDELLWNLGLSWWHENLGRIEPCRVVWVEPCRVV